jgi:hypothetical protein
LDFLGPLLEDAAASVGSASPATEAVPSDDGDLVIDGRATLGLGFEGLGFFRGGACDPDAVGDGGGCTTCTGAYPGKLDGSHASAGT